MSAEALYSPGKRAGPLGCLYERPTSTRADSALESPSQSTSSPSARSSSSRKLLDAFRTSRPSNNSADAEPSEDHHRRRWRTSGSVDLESSSTSNVAGKRDVQSPPIASSFKSGHRRANSHSAANRHTTGAARSLISKLTGSPKKSSQLALPDHEPQRFVIYEDAEGISQEPVQVESAPSPGEDEFDESYNDENAAPAPGPSRSTEASTPALGEAPQASTSALRNPDEALQVPASAVQRHSTPEDQIIDHGFAPAQGSSQASQSRQHDGAIVHEDPGPDQPTVKRPRIQ